MLRKIDVMLHFLYNAARFAVGPDVGEVYVNDLGEWLNDMETIGVFNTSVFILGTDSRKMAFTGDT